MAVKDGDVTELAIKGTAARILVVQEEAQGKGIGKNLLNKIVAYAKKKACFGVFLASAIKRKESHIFYKKNGFINIGSLFFRPIKIFA